MSASGGSTSKPTIMLMHGLWLTPRSWEGWIDRYKKAGYNVIAPSWPGLEGEVEAIRKDPSPLKGLKLKTVVDHYDRIIRKLDAQPRDSMFWLSNRIHQVVRPAPARVSRTTWDFRRVSRGRS